MKYIDIASRNEWLPPPNGWDGVLPAGVLEYAESHWFFSQLPDGKMVEWTPTPVLVDIPTSEQPEPTFSPKSFIERFTLDELVAIYTHAEQTVQVRIWLDRLTGADYILLSDQSLKDGMAYLVFQGFLSLDRHNQIMDLP